MGLLVQFMLNSSISPRQQYGIPGGCLSLSAPCTTHSSIRHHNRRQKAKESNMTKAEFVKQLKEQAGLSTLAQAEAAYEKLFGIITGALKKGDAVSVTGFGSFKVIDRKARKGRNPRTGKEIKIPASKAVKFTPGKALKESL